MNMQIDPRSLPKGIRLRGQSLVVEVFHDGKRKQESMPLAGFAGPKEAITEAQTRRMELKSEMARGKQVQGKGRGSSWTLEHAIKYTDTHEWADTRARKSSFLNARAAQRFFGKGLPLDQIKRDDLDRYVEHLKAEGMSNATINRKLAALRKVMNTAKTREKLESIPQFPRLREPVGRIRFLTSDEEDQVLTTLELWGKDDVRAAVVMLIDTGMRRGELLRLTAQDVDLSTGMISIWQTKADLPRSVPMTSRVREIVERRATSGKLFQGMSKDALSHTFRRVRDHLGLEDDTQLVVHALRHTCASRLVQRGVPLKVVQEWMGHRDITTTMRYAHLAPSNLQAAAAVLEQDHRNP